MAFPPVSALALFFDQPCSDGSLSCTLRHILPWLYTAAAVLAIVLILVTALAVRLWRKNKDSSEPR